MYSKRCLASGGNSGSLPMLAKRSGAYGLSGCRSAMSLPVEGFLLPYVHISDGEETDEDEHLAEEEHSARAARGVAVDDRPRVEERRLDVEEHGDLVEADVDPLPVDVEQRHASLIRRELGGIALVPPDEPVQRQHHHPEGQGDDEHDEDRKERVRHESGAMLMANQRAGQALWSAAAMPPLSTATARRVSFSSPEAAPPWRARRGSDRRRRPAATARSPRRGSLPDAW